MLATYQGETAGATLSAQARLQVEEQARSKASGSAQRAGTVALVTPHRVVAEDNPEYEATSLARKEQIMSRIMEYGVAQLSYMRARMAKCIRKKA
jgi:hypothetical protein